VTAPVSRKAQVTLPKMVREFLGIDPLEEVGFILDEASHSVRITKVEITASSGDYSDEEITKLLDLKHEKGGKAFRTIQTLLKDLKE